MRRSPLPVTQLERAVLTERAARSGQTRAELATALGLDPQLLGRPMTNPPVQSARVTRTGHKDASLYWPSP
jgi:hypothetical protein